MKNFDFIPKINLDNLWYWNNIKHNGVILSIEKEMNKNKRQQQKVRERNILCRNCGIYQIHC